ncbi:MAG TPA: flagellar motor switch protein FliN [Candidatus Angelobacter sp.]|jgi:flagellar motor switch protein FliN/FliY|nr:flagellar motor switch protein FliN [Candidatus Angelobacter sp.]
MATNDNVFGVANYYSLWSQSAAATLSQLTGKELTAEITAAVEEPEGERFWATFTMTDALLGEQGFSVSKADALHLGQLFIGETADPNAEFNADHIDALAELFRQFAGTVALQLKGILGRECIVRFKDIVKPAWESADASALIVKTDPLVTIAMGIDTGLLNSVNKVRVAADEPEPVAAAEPARQQAPAPPPRSPAPQPPGTAIIDDAPPAQVAHLTFNDRNLDLLLDVELQVSIRFGRRQMLLKDVLDLSSGAMVELDRRVRDPIELLLGGRVIARGEAVIVDGNYGIRITEIVSPSQRLAEIA